MLKDRFGEKISTTSRKVPIFHVQFYKSHKDSIKFKVLSKNTKSGYQIISSPPLHDFKNLNDYWKDRPAKKIMKDIVNELMTI